MAINAETPSESPKSSWFGGLVKWGLIATLVATAAATMGAFNNVDLPGTSLDEAAKGLSEQGKRFADFLRSRLPTPGMPDEAPVGFRGEVDAIA